jgi:thiol-disulfide isomerase/thioredoxin
VTHLARTLAPLVLLALVACGGPTPTPDPFADLGMPPGMEIPDMTVAVYQGADRLGGEEVRLSEVLAQGKPVVVNFWAALCPPCLAEMPEFQEVYEARKDEAVILGVDIGPQFHLGTREQGRRLLGQLDIHYPAGTTFSENVARDYRLLAMPSTLFVHPDGRLMRHWTGPLTGAKLNELIDDLLRG